MVRKRKAGNGESIFRTRDREEPPQAESGFREEEREVHPGAGFLNMAGNEHAVIRETRGHALGVWSGKDLLTAHMTAGRRGIGQDTFRKTEWNRG